MPKSHPAQSWSLPHSSPSLYLHPHHLTSRQVMNSALDCKRQKRSLGCWSPKSLHLRWIGLRTAADQGEQSEKEASSLRVLGCLFLTGVGLPFCLFTLKSNTGYQSQLWFLKWRLQIALCEKRCPPSWTIAHYPTCIVIYFKNNF